MSDSLTFEKLLELYESLSDERPKFIHSGRVHTSEYCVEQFRFPTTKKRRIRNKWAKRDENFRPLRSVLVAENGDYYVHPLVAQKFIHETLHPN